MNDSNILKEYLDYLREQMIFPAPPNDPLSQCRDDCIRKYGPRFIKNRVILRRCFVSCRIEQVEKDIDRLKRMMARDPDNKEFCDECKRRINELIIKRNKYIEKFKSIK